MRDCGILLPVSSLPSRYGIGAFSKEAYSFVDRLKKAGAGSWQILPLGPTGYGDSPYQPFSSFAGNPYFIDLDTLIEEGLLTKEECTAFDFGKDKRYVDYGCVYNGRYPLLRKAYERFIKKESIEEAAARLSDKTRDYCFYMALKTHFKSQCWNFWDKDIRLRRPEALARYKKLLSREIGFYEFMQVKFEEQWLALKSYANKKGIRIIGDLPIYVAYDGSDAWAHPELFQFDEENLPKTVAGCPPDAFSSTGQLWGNPLYDWDYHKKTGYQWWMERMAYSFKLYDVVRLDHFRGFDEYYAIPNGDKTAQFGHWEPGPGMELFERMRAYFKKDKLPIIAEDLGFLTPTVLALLKESAFPGMKVLEFAFDSSQASTYLPHNYDQNCVVYTGTHDNDTAVGWYQSLDKRDRAFFYEYIGGKEEEGKNVNWALIRLAMASTADHCVIPMQDLLGLGSEARINAPSTLGKNWRWRMLEGEFTEEIAMRLGRMVKIYGRTPKEEASKKTVS